MIFGIQKMSEYKICPFDGQVPMFEWNGISALVKYFNGWSSQLLGGSVCKNPIIKEQPGLIVVVFELAC